MKHCTWFLLPSPYVKSSANPNLLIATIDLRIIGRVGTSYNIEDSLEESTSLSREIDE